MTNEFVKTWRSKHDGGSKICNSV